MKKNIFFLLMIFATSLFGAQGEITKIDALLIIPGGCTNCATARINDSNIYVIVWEDITNGYGHMKSFSMSLKLRRN